MQARRRGELRISRWLLLLLSTLLSAISRRMARAWHHDAVPRRSSQDRVLAGYAKVGAKIGGQKIQVGLSCARKTVEVIVEADTRAAPA